MKRALAVLLLFTPVGCADPDPGGQRVLLIGIDGATLRVASPLMQQGRLPVLRGIGEVGVAGPLRSHQPLVSPRIWTSKARFRNFFVRAMAAASCTDPRAA